MAKKTLTTISGMFEQDIVEDDAHETAVIAPGGPNTKKARVRGTWKMFWGREVYDFVDGRTYNLPVELYEHLKAHGNIYDHL